MSVTKNRNTVARYVTYCQRERGRSPQTVYKYALSLESLCVHLGPVLLEDADVDLLRVWVHAPMVRGSRGKQAGQDAAPATVKRKVAELRSFYRWLHEIEGSTMRNEAMKLSAPAVHNENPHPAPEGSWKALWRSDLSDSDRVAFGLGFFCGLRRHEVTQLAPGHVVDVPEPRLVAFKRKGGKKANLPWLSCVRIHEERRPDLCVAPVSFEEAFKRLRHDRAGKPTLVSWADTLNTARRWTKYDMPLGFVDPHQFNRRLWLALEAAELPRDAFTPHQLRHSFCTNLLNMGVPILAVSRLANHSSVVITQRYIATQEDPLEGMLEGARSHIPSPYEGIGT